MNTIKEVLSIPGDFISIVYTDCKKNKGMWLAYAFFAAGIIVVLASAGIAIHLTLVLLDVMIKQSPSFAHDNPVPFILWIIILVVMVELLKEVYAIYKEIRFVILKGNR